MATWPGSAYPLGATFDGSGTNFALFSEVAEKIELCLFYDTGGETRVELLEIDAYVWHAYLPQVQPGQRYGYRVYGEYDPESGKRCNPKSCSSTRTQRLPAVISTGIRRSSHTISATRSPATMRTRRATR